MNQLYQFVILSVVTCFLTVECDTCEIFSCDIFCTPPSPFLTSPQHHTSKTLDITYLAGFPFIIPEGKYPNSVNT